MNIYKFAYLYKYTVYLYIFEMFASSSLGLTELDFGAHWELTKQLSLYKIPPLLEKKHMRRLTGDAAKESE